MPADGTTPKYECLLNDELGDGQGERQKGSDLPPVWVGVLIIFLILLCAFGYAIVILSR